MLTRFDKSYYEIARRAADNQIGIDWKEHLGDFFTFVTRQTGVRTEIYGRDAQARFLVLSPLDLDKMTFIARIVKKVAKSILFVFSIPLFIIGTLFYECSLSRQTAMLNSDRQRVFFIQEISFEEAFKGFTKKELKILISIINQSQGKISLDQNATLTKYKKRVVFNYTIKLYSNGDIYFFRRLDQNRSEIKRVSLPTEYKEICRKIIALPLAFHPNDVIEEANYSVICRQDCNESLISLVNETLLTGSSSAASSSTVTTACDYEGAINAALGAVAYRNVKRIDKSGYTEYQIPEAALEDSFTLKKSLKEIKKINPDVNVCMILRIPKEQIFGKSEEPLLQIQIGEDTYTYMNIGLDSIHGFFNELNEASDSASFNLTIRSGLEDLIQFAYIAYDAGMKPELAN